MRRPTLCGGTAAQDADDEPDRADGPDHHRPDKPAQGGRLSRVRRLLADSLLLGGRRSCGSGGGGSSGTALVSAAADRTARQFGVPLRDVDLNKEGVPVVVARICTYLENQGLQCEGLFQSSATNSKVAEGLRTTLDLEGANDVFTTALLLQLWLNELPEPIVWGPVASELLATHGKVAEESISTWRQAIRMVLCTLPETNLRLLRYILRFLHRYNHHQLQRSSKSANNAVLDHLGSVFAPILILRGLEYYGSDQNLRASTLTSRLIQDHASLFHQWLVDHPTEVSPNTTNRASPTIHKKCHQRGSFKKLKDDSEKNFSQHRKRKERNESSNSNQSLERKVIRSSSEERCIELIVADNKSESIRRVSSHEDFSRVKQKNKASAVNRSKFTTVVEVSDQSQLTHLPLQESNHIESTTLSKDTTLPGLNVLLDSGSQHKENELQHELPQPLRGRERLHVEMSEEEHERRRSKERFSRSLGPSRNVTRRNVGRKARAYQLDNTASDKVAGSSKTHEALQNIPKTSVLHTDSKKQNVDPSSSEERVDLEAEVESLSDESRPGSSHSFLQLHPPERERSPSPSVSPCTPPLDLTTLHQSVDGNEPVASRVSWDFVRPQPQDDEEPCGILLSPRNSLLLTRRVFMDHNVPPSPPGEHRGSCLPGSALDLENKVKKLNKQIANIKKKLKRYEDGFEREFGYRPSQSDKMANKDIKKMCMDLSRIRKELKQVKDYPLSVMASQCVPSSLHVGLPGQSDEPLSCGNISNESMEETVAEVERRLKEKRQHMGRPESIDDMSVEQQASEKLAMQKALLMLEKICGRATSKQDREIVRPLYDRYRQLKRIVARAASSKLKDSITELATIHEHEAMDFTPSTSLSTMPENGAGARQSGGEMKASASTPGTGNTCLQMQPNTEETSDSQTSSSDSLGENLHALPLSDLVLQLTQIREEKKKLRRLLREQEDQFQQQTGRRMQREDRAVAAAADVGAKDYTVIYSSYKQVKARLRLLEALIAKQR